MAGCLVAMHTRTCSTRPCFGGGAATFPGVGRDNILVTMPDRDCQKGTCENAARAVTVPQLMSAVWLEAGRRLMAAAAGPATEEMSCGTRVEELNPQNQQGAVPTFHFSTFHYNTNCAQIVVYLSLKMAGTRARLVSATCIYRMKRLADDTD